MGFGWYADWEREQEEREEERWEEEQRRRTIEENKKNDVAIVKTEEPYKFYEYENGQISMFPPLKVVKTRSNKKQKNITYNQVSNNENADFSNNIENER